MQGMLGPQVSELCRVFRGLMNAPGGPDLRSGRTSTTEVQRKSRDRLCSPNPRRLHHGRHGVHVKGKERWGPGSPNSSVFSVHSVVDNALGVVYRLLPALLLPVGTSGFQLAGQLAAICCSELPWFIGWPGVLPVRLFKGLLLGLCWARPSNYERRAGWPLRGERDRL